MFKLSTVALTVLLFLSTSLWASEAQITNLPPNVSIYQLDNGMQVLMIENPALPMVGVNVVVKVGSAYETFATSGMSHMLEHLLFNGTTTRTQKQLYDDVDLIGGYNNANTSDYYTNFMMVTPAENIRKGMEIQADMLFHSTLPLNKYKKEKGIVLEEISKTLADPDEQAERNILSVLFKGHALSLPTLGTYSTIEAMPRDAVCKFYKNNYVPNNMLLSVIGNFNSAQMLKWINDIYGKATPGVIQREPLPDWSVGFDKTHLQIPVPGSVYHRFYAGKTPLLQLFYSITGKHDPVFFELLDKKLNKLAQSIKPQLGADVRNVRMQTRTTPVANFVQVTLALKAPLKSYDSLMTKINTLLDKTDFAFTKEEILAEANKAKTAFLKNIEKPHMFGIYNAHQIAINGFESVLNSYNSTIYTQAATELKSLKIDHQPIILIQLPENTTSASIKEQPLVTKLFPGGNGNPTLIVKQNKASNLLAIHYLFKHKAPLESKFGKDAARILHDCFGQRMRSKANLKVSAQFGLTLKVNDNPYIPMDDIYMNPDFGYIRVEALNNDIQGLIQYLNAQMKNFIPTEAEFKQAKAKLSGPNPMMMMGRGNPAKKLFKKLYQKEIYEASSYKPASSELTYKRLLEFAKQYFQPGNMIISVVSSAAPEDVAKWFDGFTGQPWPNEPKPYMRTLRLHDRPVTIEKQGGGSRSYLFYGFTEPIDSIDEPALQALSLILGDKIVFDIREKQGMAYRLSAGISMRNGRALFYIEQGTRPKNVDKLVPQYPGFFSPKILKDVKEKDLQKSINMYLGRMMFRRLSSINQAYYLGTSYYFHKDIHYDEQFLQNLKNVTLQDVKRVAKKYLHVKNPVLIIVR